MVKAVRGRRGGEGGRPRREHNTEISLKPYRKPVSGRTQQELRGKISADETAEQMQT